MRRKTVEIVDSFVGRYLPPYRWAKLKGKIKMSTKKIVSFWLWRLTNPFTTVTNPSLSVIIYEYHYLIFISDFISYIR